jgi:hypothetical protein
MSTSAQALASRTNGALSHGPVSESGKATSSKNALKTGLTGRTVLLPSEDAARYEAHLAEFRNRFEPVGSAETNLVQSLADTQWRLARIPSLEMSLFALGRLEFAALFPEQQDPAVRQALLEAKIYLAYERQLRNLGIQESRLRRQYENDAAALEQLQTLRRRERQQQLDSAARDYIVAVQEDTTNDFNPVALGFEFSMEEIEVRALELKPDLFADYERELAEKREKQKRAA